MRLKIELFISVILFFVSHIFAQQHYTIPLDTTVEVTSFQLVNTNTSEISPFFVKGMLYYNGIKEEYRNKQGRLKRNTAFYTLYSLETEADSPLAKPHPVAGFEGKFQEGPSCYCDKTGELFVTLSNIVNPDSIKNCFSPKENIRLRLVIKKYMNNSWVLTSELPFNTNKYNYAHPAINETGDTLIFSSDMDDESRGQADLFFSIRENGKWSTPKNLGSAINTAGNEMFPTFLPDGRLTFASDGHKNGAGGLDIYFTDRIDSKIIHHFDNAINSQADDFGLALDFSEEYGYFSSNRNGSDDIFRFNILILPSVFSGQIVDEVTNKPLAGAILKIADCEEGQLESLKSDNNGNFNFQLHHSDCGRILVNMDNYKSTEIRLTKGINTIIKLAPEIKHELLVLDASTKQPVKRAKIRCNNKDFAESNDNGLVLLDINVTGAASYMIQKEGYLTSSVVISAEKKTESTKDTLYLYPQNIGKSFILENIRYDLNKWVLTPESKIELENLVQILNDNPTIRIELSSHTDSRGKHEYNQWLSDNRSASVVNYLIEKGIKKSRLVSKGYGESRLLNQCKNGVECSEEEHQQNRRTEFKIID